MADVGGGDAAEDYVDVGGGDAAEDYVKEEVRQVMGGRVEPHKLIRERDDEETYYVVVASLAELDTALAKSGITAGCLLVQVLPTATLTDCRVIMDAATAGKYRGLDLVLLSTPEGEDPVRAKLGYSQDVIQARRDLEDAATNLVALAERQSRSGLISQDGTLHSRPEIRPGAATRAHLGAEQWNKHVKDAETSLQRRLRYTADRLRSIGGTLCPLSLPA